MALSPGRACRWPGCTEIIRHGSYCDKHKTRGRKPYDKATDDKRGSARQRGDTTLNGINLDVGSLTNQVIRYATGALSKAGSPKAELVHQTTY